MKQLLLLICLLASTALCAVAQGSDITLPATFVYKKASEGLAAGTYILSGTNEDGADFFLTSNFYKKTKKLLGEVLETNDGRVKVENDYLLWKIEQTNNGTYTLFSVKEKKYLTGTTGALGLEFGSKGCEWYASFTEQGNLVLRLKDEYRLLSVWKYINKESINFFDYYGEGGNSNSTLGLKVFQPTFSYISGPNTLPQDDARLCIGSAASLRLSDGTGTGLSDALLKDGSVAPSDELPTYTASVAADGTFSFKGKGGYLDYNLRETSSEVRWTITNGHICTTEDVARYLCYQDNEWKLCNEESAKTDARIYAVADEPQYAVDEDGVCTLTGGWNANRLTEFTAEGVRCLDLTKASLPATLKSFTNLPPNAVVFASSEYEDGLAKTNRIAVVCGNENVMVNVSYQFTDREPFYTDRRFKVGANQLSYRRSSMTADAWQTLSLPFPAKVENGRAFAYSGTIDGALQFEETTSIEANKGYIILPSAMGTFTAVSQEGYMECTEGSSLLKGTNETLKVGQNGAPVYLLHPTGQCFRQAAAGSTLPPFRAYFQSGNQRTIRILLKGI